MPQCVRAIASQILMKRKDPRALARCASRHVSSTAQPERTTHHTECQSALSLASAWFWKSNSATPPARVRCL